MIINKIIVGFVVQQFDTDAQKFINQEFVASDDVSYAVGGDEINVTDFLKRVVGAEPYLPLEMKQP